MKRWTGTILVALPACSAFAFLWVPLRLFDLSTIDVAILEPGLRSGAVAFATTILSAVLGLAVGWWLFRRQIPDAVAAWMLIPFCLGSASWAFLFLPIVPWVPGISAREPVAVLMVLITVNVLQYTPLQAFICHQALKNSANARSGLIAATQMVPSESVKFVFWPDINRFLLFVAAIVFCSALSEHEKALLYFRASAGTDTSLIPQAMRDLYIKLNGFHDVALTYVISTSVVVIAASAVLLVATLALCALLCQVLLKYLAQRTGMPPLARFESIAENSFRSSFFLWSSLLLFVISCLWSFFMSDGLIIFALIPVAVASLIATLLYASYCFILRLSNARLWDDGQVGTRWLFVGTLLLVRLLPSALLFYVIISYTIFLEQQARSVRWAAWFLAHLLYNSVVIIPFLVLLLLSVARAEIDLLRASDVSRWDISRISLLMRFRRELVTIFLFVFVLIWNGDSANMAMSSVFQSANLEIVTKLYGRNYSLSRALELTIPTVALAILAVTLLGKQSIRKLQRDSRGITRLSLTKAI